MKTQPPSQRLNVLALAFCAGLVPSVAPAADNNGGGLGTQDAAVGSLAPNQGHFICTAAINSAGSIAGGNFVNVVTADSGTLGGTRKLSLGTYSVGFVGPCGNVQSKNGWFRVVQPDRLSAGPLPPRICTVSDRFLGAPTNVILIQCFNGATGALADTSFTISVSR